MGYNRKNFFKRIVEIQDITLEHKRKGCTQKWVYDNIIFPRYHISQATYYNYMASTAKADLKKMLKEEDGQPEMEL